VNERRILGERGYTFVRRFRCCNINVSAKFLLLIRETRVKRHIHHHVEIRGFHVVCYINIHDPFRSATFNKYCKPKNKKKGGGRLSISIAWIISNRNASKPTTTHPHCLNHQMDKFLVQAGKRHFSQWRYRVTSSPSFHS